MNLYTAIDQYMTLKRSLGAVFSAETRILRMFGRTVGDISLEEISPESCHTFCRGKGPPTLWWERKHYVIQQFFAFIASRGHLTSSPFVAKAPKISRSFEPYIYSHDELTRLLNATAILENGRSPLQHLIFRVLILVLYVTGLRPGEGLRLRCCDVDLGDQVLAIWDTKFFKSRFVPIGHQLSRVLGSYRTERLRLPMPEGPRSAFFPSPTGHSIKLKWLERIFARLRDEAGVHRLSSLHSLFRFISGKVPELVEQATQIQAIPPRRTVTPTMDYLDKHEVDALLAVPDRGRLQGCRDHALLLFLYNSGARASEAAATSIGDLTLQMTSPAVRLLGKGRKIRRCPLWHHTANILRDLLGPRIDGPAGAPVFLNVRGQPITRYGIHDLVVRTAAKAAMSIPSILTKQVSPHTIRHTTAVHLLRAGVDINTIRAWLGHVSLATTNRYAQIDLEMKAAALEACAIRETDTGKDSNTPLWTQDTELLAFLTSL